MKTKGARLTTEISLPGRFVVYVPHGDGLGVSRRLDDDERNRLKSILKEIAPKTGGVIVRTAAEGASAEDIGRDLEFLMRLWATIDASAKKATAPALIYQEAELPLRVTRDLFTGDFEKLVVDHDRTHKRIVGYLKKTSPHMVERVDALQGAHAAPRGARSRAGDPVDAQPPGRPALGRLPDLRLRRGVHGHRRQHGPLRRLALEAKRRRTARGHDHEEQPRGGQARSCASSGCATSAGSSSSTSSTWRTRRTASRSRMRSARSSSATARRPTSSRSRRSASSR